MLIWQKAVKNLASWLSRNTSMQNTVPYGKCPQFEAVNSTCNFITYDLSLNLFDCMKFIVPLENFSLIWWRHHCQWRAANFDLCSALMAIEQWGLFNVPHLLSHGTSFYNGHTVTLTSNAECLAVELSLPVLTT